MRRGVTFCFAAGFATLILCATVAKSQTAGIDDVLKATNDAVDVYLQQIARVRCTEYVTQQKLSPNGREEHAANTAYDYFIVVHGDEHELALNETRGDLNPEASSGKTQLPLLFSNGFPTLVLIFHPYYQNSFHFEVRPPEMIEGKPLLPVHFVYVPGTRSPAVLALRGREYPLPITGTAWIEAGTGSIARIQAKLTKDMSDIGLRSFSAQVDYAPVRLQGADRAYYLPAIATVEVESLRQHWRNVHRFAEYHRFGVDTKISMPDGELNQ
jgi:hypothetical protein